MQANRQAELITRIRGLSAEDLGRLDVDTLAKINGLVNGAAQDHKESLAMQTVASFEFGPLYWLTTLTATENAKHEAQGLPFIGPFPRRSYFIPLFHSFLTADRLLVPKSREMLTSLSLTGYAVWRAQFFRWDCILQSLSLDKIKELILYSGNFYRFQPDWLKRRHPLKSTDPLQYELVFEGGGRVKAIPSGGVKWRTYHATLAAFDECAFQVEMSQSWAAAQPTSQQMIGISTAAPGFFADQCSH